jgi:predicted nucleotidyltransferase
MSSLVRIQSAHDLSTDRLTTVLSKIVEKLDGRVSAAYIFGSASTGEINSDSDIDLIFVKEGPLGPFVQRGFEFADLFEIFPRLDILVYSQDELNRQLADSEIGFWKSVRLSMRRIL